jgi:hypothetical protein
MDRKTILTLSIVIVISAASLYMQQAGGIYNSNLNKDTAVEVALNFIESSPTFKFDGIFETLAVKEYTVLESLPLQHVVAIEFECKHGGYGDRTEQIVVQAITSHLAVVKVVENVVASAVIDEQWNEMNQQMQDSSCPTKEIVIPEMARHIAIKHILSTHQDIEVQAPQTWDEKDLTPEGIVGLSILQFIGDNWTVTVSNPVVWKPTYTVEVIYSGDRAFSWKGTVAQDEIVQELEFTDAQ